MGDHEAPSEAIVLLPDDARAGGLDLLDAEFTSRQDRVDEALESGDLGAAAAAYEESAKLSVVDADGYRWHIAAPSYRELKSLHRYRYTYRRGVDGPLDGDPVAARGRFVPLPSLARTYADRIRDGGLLRWIVLWSEPLGYVAGIAIAIGLWFLLGDLIGDLPESVVFSLIVLAAIGLWTATWWLGSIPFREASRTAVVTRIAAIGVTGWLPWVATIGFSDLDTELRIALSAGTVLVIAGWVFRSKGGVLEYLVSLGSWVVFAPALAVTVADFVTEDAPLDPISLIAVLAATAVAFPIATKVGERRWMPGVIIALAVVSSIAEIGFTDGSSEGIITALGVVLGFGAAASCWWSRRWMHTKLRAVHRWSAIAITAISVVVTLTVGPWDVIWEWLEDMPLPVVLVVVGSITLVVIAAAIRTAVRRVSDD